MVRLLFELPEGEQLLLPEAASIWLGEEHAVLLPEPAVVDIEKLCTAEGVTEAEKLA